MIYLRKNLEYCKGCETHIGCLNFQFHLYNTVFKSSEPPEDYLYK